MRFNGGANAGHTLVVGSEKYAFHLLPCGFINRVLCACTVAIACRFECQAFLYPVHSIRTFFLALRVRPQ